MKSAKWGLLGDNIQWNFAKFLVDKNGQVSDRYYPTTSPLSMEVTFLFYYSMQLFYIKWLVLWLHSLVAEGHKSAVGNRVVAKVEPSTMWMDFELVNAGFVLL